MKQKIVLEKKESGNMSKTIKNWVFCIVASVLVFGSIDSIYAMNMETQEKIVEELKEQETEGEVFLEGSSNNSEYKEIEENLVEEEDMRRAELSSGQWKYTVDSSLHATITAYTGNSSSVSIPSYLGEYEVKSIGQGLFQDNTNLRSVIIPESVTEIGNLAFKNCVNLSSVTINATGLKDLSSYFASSSCEYYSAFYNTGTNTQGMTVTFGNGVTRIPSYLFATGKEKSDNIYCHIKTLKMSGTITELGESAFKNCYDIKNVTWGTNLKKIGANCFENCEEIESVVIPASATQIGGCAFKNCVMLSSLTINAASLEDASSYSVTSSCENYSVFYNAGTKTQGMTVTFGGGVTRIPSYLFTTGKEKSDNIYCHIRTLKISDTVTEIGQSAFKNCYDIENVDWSTSLKRIDANSFENCEKIGSVMIPTSATQIGGCAFKNCIMLSNVTINAVSLEDASGYSATNSCENYSIFYNAGTKTQGMTVTLGEGVTRIPSYLFATGKGKADNVYCHITTLNMNNMVTEIGESAFENCYDINTINWGPNLKKIGEYSFYNCEKIESVMIPASVTRIGKGAFQNCTMLSNITINAISLEDTSGYSTTSSCENYSVFYNTGTVAGGMTVTFGNGVTRIPAYLFATGKGIEYNTYCHVTSVKIPSTVQSIGACAFYNCYNLSKVECASQTASVGDDILKGCPNVTLYAYTLSPIAQYALANGIACVFYDTVFPTVPSIDKITLNSNNVQLSKTTITYNGRAQRPSIVARDHGGSLIDPANYTVSYANNKNVGKATVTVKFNGNYQGTVKKSFNIVPKGTAIVKLTAKKRGISVKWKKQAVQTTGYEIQYSTSSKFKGAKKIGNIRAKTTSKSISKLKAKKRYYVRIRTYKTVKGKRHYSGWSKSRSVKTKG